jgi:hypothetical protein
MPILLTGTAREIKGTAFQVVKYFEITAPARKTIHENTRSRTDCVRSIGVISWIVLARAEEKRKAKSGLY